MDAHYYPINLEWIADRKGIMSSPELKGSLEVATPPQFPGGVEGIWSPEHLLTAAVSSCFMTTFLAIAANSKLEFSTLHCNAKGKMEKVDNKFLMTEILLKPVLVINHANDFERAERIIEKAEAACLIANSIKSKVVLISKITIAELKEA